VSGFRVDPFDANVDDIDVTDIARALSNQCRLGGHCRVFYSVAQHAPLASDLMLERTEDPTDSLWAVLHDASEAYLVDLPHPAQAPQRARPVVQRVRGPAPAAHPPALPAAGRPPPLLKEIDRSLLATERQLFSSIAWHWPELDGVEPLDLEMRPWRPERALRELLRRFERLGARRDATS
jgi:hypothetical protein